MAVGSGWVGSQVVAETGQRWMSAAGAALRAPAPFWMSSLVGKSVVGVASYANPQGSGHDARYWYYLDSQYVDITLTAPFSGVVATNNPNLVVSTSDVLFKDNTTAGVTYGTSITATSRQRFFIGLMFVVSQDDTRIDMPNTQWQLLLNGSAVATYTSNFFAYRSFDTSTDDDW
ncbi:hypothetical protein CWK15_14050 [Salmonella enterica]|uniref:Phage tail fibre adhesin Gp38 N-terminal domain-containing protein n=1 Tax=Salmonella enterica TaxID=28901 RepID=A0A5V4Z6X9_SALER|nr:hypothetical protein [Salmonella enterica]EIU1711121.1 hypothetical protein [Salmonella enterica]